MASDAEAIIDTLATLADTPAAVSVDGVSISERSLAEVEGAAKAVARKNASTAGGFGLRCQKHKLGSAIGSKNIIS